jgi:endonuclease-3 related protein
MPSRSSYSLKRLYDVLWKAYGPQGWWPARTTTEVAIGAVLTQNTSWRNVERAIAALETADLLDFRRLHEVEEAALAECIRPAGTFRVKARRLKALAAWVWRRGSGSLEAALLGDGLAIRRDLLSVPGIGAETADAILLYAGKHARFVVDAYTRRILIRHGLIGEDATYDAIQARFERDLAPDAAMFNEYHALLVELGKRHCRARARCEGCPLESWPHDADTS